MGTTRHPADTLVAYARRLLEGVGMDAAIAADLAWLDRLIAEERATAPAARAGADTEPGGNP